MCKPKKIDKNDKTGRVPEFSLMSKGLGKSYLSEDMQKWHLADNRAYVRVDGNKKQGMPRYYNDKIFNAARKEKIKEQRSIVQSDKAKKIKNISIYERDFKEYVKLEEFKLKIPYLKTKI